MNRSTFYTAGTRLVQGVSGIAAIAATATLLSPFEQGVFFSIASLMQIQSTAEMGISVVLIQVASHEVKEVGLNDSSISPLLVLSNSRIASLLKQSLFWTTIAAALFFIILAPLGILFFSKNSTNQNTFTWLIAITATAVNLIPIPLLAIMEGCGNVAKAWKIRFFQQLSSGIVLPSCLLFGLKNWSLGIAGGASFIVVLIGILLEYRFFKKLLKNYSKESGIDWWTEVWPFQWRISLSYLCGIFIVHFAVPSIFRICGAVEAGKFGLSFTALRAVSSIALSNLAAKAQILGVLVASGNRKLLDNQFDSSCKKSLFTGVIGMSGLILAFLELTKWFPQFQGRILSMSPLLVMTAAMIMQHATQCIAIYLRAHKEEPMLLPSILGAAMLGVGFPIVAREWGVLGVAYWFFTTTAILGVGASLILFHLKRKSFI